MPSSCWGDYTFESGTTYLVKGTTYFGGGTVTFQPGCIIKFSGGYLLMYGGIVCNGRDWMPSILTSKDDDVYGETDYGTDGTSTHCPSYVADPALWDYYITNNVSLIGMKIRWAQTAIEFDGSGDPYCNGYPDCCGETNSVTECSLEFCQTGILVNRVCRQHCQFRHVQRRHPDRFGMDLPVVPDLLRQPDRRWHRGFGSRWHAGLVDGRPISATRLAVTPTTPWPPRMRTQTASPTSRNSRTAATP